MENDNALFSATMVLTAYVDENGNVKYVKSDWDSLFEKNTKECNYCNATDSFNFGQCISCGEQQEKEENEND
jgi:hypothetical protein